MKYLIGILCIAFVICDYAFTINPIIRNTVFGLMSLFVIVFLVMNRKDNGLDSMFDKDDNTEKKSIFNVKDWLRK